MLFHIYFRESPVLYRKEIFFFFVLSYYLVTEVIGSINLPNSNTSKISIRSKSFTVRFLKRKQNIILRIFLPFIN